VFGWLLSRRLLGALARSRSSVSMPSSESANISGWLWTTIGGGPWRSTWGTMGAAASSALLTGTRSCKSNPFTLRALSRSCPCKGSPRRVGRRGQALRFGLRADVPPDDAPGRHLAWPAHPLPAPSRLRPHARVLPARPRLLPSQAFGGLVGLRAAVERHGRLPGGPGHRHPRLPPGRLALAVELRRGTLPHRGHALEDGLHALLRGLGAGDGLRGLLGGPRGGHLRDHRGLGRHRAQVGRGVPPVPVEAVPSVQGVRDPILGQHRVLLLELVEEAQGRQGALGVHVDVALGHALDVGPRPLRRADLGRLGVQNFILLRDPLQGGDGARTELLEERRHSLS